MDFLHYPVRVTPLDVVVVNISGKANVLMLDDLNFKKYSIGKKFEYKGGLSIRTTVRFSVPYKGLWHIVVDMRGLEGTVKATVDIAKGANG